MTSAPHLSIARKILQYVIENPGCSREGINTVAPSTATYGTVSSTISYLRIEGYIENRGGHGKAARWYWTAEPGTIITKFYLDLANELVAELRAKRLAEREAHLARRLQDIFGER